MDGILVIGLLLIAGYVALQLVLYGIAKGLTAIFPKTGLGQAAATIVYVAIYFILVATGIIPG